MQYDKKYPIRQNLAYCARETWRGCPKLLAFFVMLILANCLVPVITTFLPKVVLEQITGGKPLRQLLLVTGLMTGALALLSGLKVFLEKLIYWNQFSMNAVFLRMVTRKGLTTDYRNQENEHFRTLQRESYASCNGNFSSYVQTYDAFVRFFSNLLGFLAFTGILFSLNPLLILFLCLTTVVSFLLNRRISKWLEGSREEKSVYEKRMQYVAGAADDIRAGRIDVDQLLGAAAAGSAFVPEGATAALDSIADKEYMKDVLRNADGEAAVAEITALIIPANLDAKVSVQANTLQYGELETSWLSSDIVTKGRCLQVTNTMAMTNMGEAFLEGFYSTKTRDDLKAGFDLTLSNITAEKVIRLFPAVDSILPMLKSFQGLLDCEMAATTSLEQDMSLILTSSGRC